MRTLIVNGTGTVLDVVTENDAWWYPQQRHDGFWLVADAAGTYNVNDTLDMNSVRLACTQNNPLTQPLYSDCYAARGQANGVATLGADGKVPSGQLPAGQGGAAWGGITGTLSNQTDLQTALNGKQAIGALQASILFVGGNAALVLTNMPVALNFLGSSHRFAVKRDLTNYTQVRLVVNKQSVAGAAASKIILRYITAFNTTQSNWLDIGATEVSCAINVQNTIQETAWINLVAGAKADVYICPLMSGGDGAIDPQLGVVEAQFR